MRTDGTWARLYKQWFVPGLGPTVPAPPRPQYSG